MVLIRSCVFAAAFYGWTILLCILFLPGALVTGIMNTRLSSFWCRMSFALARRILHLDYEVRGLEHLPLGACILASKHQSAWDTLVFNILRSDTVLVVKQELFWIPMFGPLLRRSGMVGIDRSGKAATLRKLIEGCQERLAEGRPVVIFPEGTRTAPGTTARYLPGVAALYGACDAPVIPVAVNSGVLWPRRQFRKTPGTIVIEFLPPVPPGLPRKEFMARLQDSIETTSRRIEEEARRR